MRKRSSYLVGDTRIRIYIYIYIHTLLYIYNICYGYIMFYEICYIYIFIYVMGYINVISKHLQGIIHGGGFSVIPFFLKRGVRSRSAESAAVALLWPIVSASKTSCASARKDESTIR